MSYEDRNEDLRDSFENASSVLETAWYMSESTDSEQMQNFVEFLQDLSCEFYALLVSAFSSVFVAIQDGVSQTTSTETELATTGRKEA